MGSGFNKDSVAAGDVVTVVGNPVRTKPDNPAGKRSPQAGRDLRSVEHRIAQCLRAEERDGDQHCRNLVLSPHGIRASWVARAGGRSPKKGKAVAASVDPKATTQKDCIPVGAPVLMFYPVANTITVQRDRVVMNVDWMESQRIVYLDGRKHPPASETSLHGHSVGRWEGKTLVVETTNFKEHPMGLSMSLPGSTQKRLTERFALGEDGKTLIYSGVIEDPVYLVKPVQWSGKWEYRPTMRHSNQKCDVEVARKFLAQ